MCFKKPTPIVVTPANRRALLFAINKYGGGNNLQGCLNDQLDVEAKLNSMFPGFDIRKFKDTEVTTQKFISELDSAIAVLQTGDVLLVHYSGHGTQIPTNDSSEPDKYNEALYLINGPLPDKTLNKSLQKIPSGAIVVLAFDSCFSGTVTRAMRLGLMEEHPTKSKFYQMPGVPIMEMAIDKIGKDKSYNMKWLCFSGCSASQTSADAYISSRYCGAFTHYWLKSLVSNSISNIQWQNNLDNYLPSQEFEQDPELEGDENLYNRVVLT